MAPVQKISKEAIIEAGCVLVEENGIECVNARNIAKKIGCSTQPIFSQFTGMEELKQAIHDEVCKRFETDIEQHMIADSFVRNSYLKLVNLARDQKHIFHLLYLSSYCKGEDFLLSRMNFHSNQRIWQELKEQYQLKEEECSNVMERISLFVHGIATLIATSSFMYEDDAIIEIVENTLDDMIQGVLKRREENE